MISPDTFIETHPYRITSSKYFGIITTQLLRQWWSVLLLFVIALVAATCFDIRFGIILLMIIFIIAPLIVFMVYYNYALRREAFYSVVEKSVIIHHRGIDCIYDEQRREVLTWQQVQRVERSPEAFYIYTQGYTYFYLPREVFQSSEEMKYFEQQFLPNILN